MNSELSFTLYVRQGPAIGGLCSNIRFRLHKCEIYALWVYYCDYPCVVQAALTPGLDSMTRESFKVTCRKKDCLWLTSLPYYQEMALKHNLLSNGSRDTRLALPVSTVRNNLELFYVFEDSWNDTHEYLRERIAEVLFFRLLTLFRNRISLFIDFLFSLPQFSFFPHRPEFRSLEERYSSVEQMFVARDPETSKSAWMAYRILVCKFKNL